MWNQGYDLPRLLRDYTEWLQGKKISAIFDDLPLELLVNDFIAVKEAEVRGR